MAAPSFNLALCFFFLLQLQIAMPESKNYIIQIDHSYKPASFPTHKAWHQSILKSLSNPVLDKNFLYSYNHVLHGFSARLTATQAAEIQNHSAHLAIHEDSFGRLLTTHSPDFLGLNHKSGLWPASSQGEGTIIGVVDTGIWPESKSFSEEGMPPVPERWKGKCQNDKIMPFTCNNKLIGEGNHTTCLQTITEEWGAMLCQSLLLKEGKTVVDKVFRAKVDELLLAIENH
ncbi:hypothetical protein SLEP1_g4070 [Rubroshorea leprosula]|uniref:Inhibitor I9 domain-containing protein n=1 Tax=Rubroshorea leprosula TaxID=152421 RepID=A0AAV5HWC8_9ROSI|nr:hypothetical protein SLEP1_g4070 [Rubroshorea leprosula]